MAHIPKRYLRLFIFFVIYSALPSHKNDCDVPCAVRAHDKRLLYVGSLRRAGDEASETFLARRHQLVCFVHVVYNLMLRQQNHKCFRYEIYNEDRTKLLCEGMTLHAVVNKEGRPVAVPDWIRERLSALAPEKSGI